MAHHLFWGDSHLNLHSRDRERFEESFAEAREHLDFLPIAYYPFEYYTTAAGLRVESWHNRPQFLQEWTEIRALCRRYHEPGRFVTFAGYEWHGNRTRWGDHNVYYYAEDNPLDDVDDIDQLYARLRGTRALATPHHVGYATGQRAKDWDHFDPALSPFVEIFSSHGCSEAPVNRFPQVNYAMGPWTNGSTAQDALARGLKVGIVCSGDNHTAYAGVWGHGLMAAWAPELTREALWEAFLARRVYGVTGDRIRIDYRVNGACMGSEITAEGAVKARIAVESVGPLDRVEWLRNNQVLQTYCHLDGLAPDPRNPVRCRFRVEPGWGPTQHYGFEPEPEQWHGQVALSGGELKVVHGCWTAPGNRLTNVDDRTVEFQTITRGERGRPTQAFVLEATAPRNATLRIDAAPFDVTCTVGEMLERTQLWVDHEGIRDLVRQRFGHEPDEIENPDCLFHNAYKLRLVQAVPEGGFRADLDLVDPDPPAGENWYYLRVSQTDGQAAWTSPVWVAQG